jgi:hypothetical protein
MADTSLTAVILSNVINLNLLIYVVVEPIGSLQECGGPLTSLHRIIPAITQGYALCDIINGFHLISTGLGPEHLAHGVGECINLQISQQYVWVLTVTLLSNIVATFAVTTVFNELKASHVLTPYLIMEMSTIILGIVKADFLSPNMRIATQFLFVLVFFVCRLVVFPLHYFSTISLYRYGCFTPFLFYVSLLFGAFFNLLNVFWFIKMLKKIHRKFSGAESFLNADKD